MQGLSSLSDTNPKINSNEKIDGIFKMTFKRFVKFFKSGKNLKVKSY